MTWRQSRFWQSFPPSVAVDYALRRRRPPHALSEIPHLQRDGVIVWATVFVWVGYLAAESWRVAEKWVSATGKIVGGALLLVIALVWLWHWLAWREDNNKRRAGIGQ